MFETILGIILLVMSVFLIIAVLMQHGKSHGLSGTIAGGAETFFGKNKGSSLDGILSKATTAVSIVFVVLVVVAYIAQGDLSAAAGDVATPSDTTAPVETTAPADTAAPEETTAPTDTTAPADTAEPADTTAA